MRSHKAARPERTDGRRAALSMYSPLSDIIRREPIAVPLHATVREAVVTENPRLPQGTRCTAATGSCEGPGSRSRGRGESAWPSGTSEGTYRDALKRFRREYFRQVVAFAGGNVQKAAKLAGVNQSTLYRLGPAFDRAPLVSEGLFRRGTSAARGHADLPIV